MIERHESIYLGQRVWYLDEVGLPKQGVVCHIDGNHREEKWWDMDKSMSNYDTIYTCRRDNNYCTTIEHIAKNIFIEKERCISACFENILEITKND